MQFLSTYAATHRGWLSFAFGLFTPFLLINGLIYSLISLHQWIDLFLAFDDAAEREKGRDSHHSLESMASGSSASSPRPRRTGATAVTAGAGAAERGSRLAHLALNGSSRNDSNGKPHYDQQQQQDEQQQQGTGVGTGSHTNQSSLTTAAAWRAEDDASSTSHVMTHHHQSDRSDRSSPSPSSPAAAAARDGSGGREDIEGSISPSTSAPYKFLHTPPSPVAPIARITISSSSAPAAGGCSRRSDRHHCHQPPPLPSSSSSSPSAAAGATAATAGVEVLGVGLLHPALSGHTVTTFIRLLAKSKVAGGMLRRLLMSEVGEVAVRRGWYRKEALTRQVLELYQAPLKVRRGGGVRHWEWHGGVASVFGCGLNPDAKP